MSMATFFDLPLELRDQIYTIILTLPGSLPHGSSQTTTTTTTITGTSTPTSSPRPPRLPAAPSDPDEIAISWPVSTPPAASTNLLLLNRQIHREATHCMRRLASQGKLLHRLTGTLTAGYVLGIGWVLVPVATRRIAAMAIDVRVEAPAADDFDRKVWWRVLRERTGKILYTLVCQAIRFQHVDPATGPRFLLGGPPKVTIDELVLDFGIAGGSSATTGGVGAGGGRSMMGGASAFEAQLRLRELQYQLEEWIPHCVRMLKRVIQLVTKLDGLPSDLMSLPVLRKRAALRGIRQIKVGMGGRVMDSFNVEEHFS
jgi:hypothetical protein